MQALSIQKKILQEVVVGILPSALILCRHYPVITLGRLASSANIKLNQEALLKNGIVVYRVERGGDVTYHGPGQLVVYPIINLNYLTRDIHYFLRRLEEVAVSFLSGFGLSASKIPGKTGVWLGGKKIVSVGIAVKKWVTFHGMSINISGQDMANFSFIRPCGMDIEMVSLEQALGEKVAFEKIKDRLVSEFKEYFPSALTMGG